MPLKRLMNNKELAKKLNRMIQYDKYTLITVCITIIFTLYLLNLIPTKVKGTKINKERDSINNSNNKSTPLKI